MNESDWKLDGLTEDGQFACRYCKGTKLLGLPIGSKNLHECWMCNGSGYMIDSVKRDLDNETASHTRTREELNKLKDWVKRTSKCSLCHGEPYNTNGGCDCEECGLTGMKPIGG